MYISIDLQYNSVSYYTIMYKLNKNYINNNYI